MHNANPVPAPDPVELNRGRIRRKLDPLDPGFIEVIQFLVENHVGNIANDYMVLKVV